MYIYIIYLVHKIQKNYEGDDMIEKFRSIAYDATHHYGHLRLLPIEE